MRFIPLDQADEPVSSGLRFIPIEETQGQPRDAFEAAKFAQEKADNTERGWGEVASDTGLALAQGAMDFAALPGTLYGLATGNFDNAYSNIFRPGQEAADALKSDKLKAEQAALAAKVNAAEGWREKLSVGLMEGLQNGTLAWDQVARMVPGIIGGGGMGKVGEKVVTTAGQLAKAAPVAAAISGRAQPVAEAAASVVGKVGEAGRAVAASPVGKFIPDVATAGAVGTGSAIQSQSVVEDTLKEGNKIPVELFAENDPEYLPLVDQLVEGGLTRGQAMLKAREQRVSEMAQTAGLQAFAASLLTMAIPGGSTIETAALKKLKPGSGFKAAFEGGVKGAVFEPIQEGTEEASGSAVKDLQLSRADPSIDVIGNAAAAGGQGAALGLIAGAGGGAISHRGAPVPIGDGGTPTAAPGRASFSDPAGPAAQAGIRPIEVPLAQAAANGQAKAEEEVAKAAEGGKPTESMIAKVNPDLERELGLDKLRMPNVSGASTVDAVAPVGGGVEGGQPGGSVVPPGSAVDVGLTNGAGAAPAATSGSQVQPAAATAGELPPALTPTKVWTGRRGDGYATIGDANTALQSKQTASSKEGGDGLTWTVVPQADGRFVLHGYAPQQATQPADSRIGSEAPAVPSASGEVGGTLVAGASPIAGGGNVNPSVNPGTASPVLAGSPQAADQAGGGVAAAGGGVPGGRATAAVPAGAAAVGSPTAPVHGGGEQAASLIDPAKIAEDITWVENDRLKRGEAIKLEVVTNEQDPTLADLATAMKAPIYFVRTKSGKSGFSGFTRNGRIAVNLSGKAAPVATVMHEAVHTMPTALRKALIDKVMPELSLGARDEFLHRYPAYASRPEDKIQEEIVAKLTENAVEEPAFWEDVKTKLGDSDFKGLVKHILSTLTRLIGAAKAHNNTDLARDWTKVRSLIAEATAKTMKGDTAWIDEATEDRATMDGAEVTEIEPDQVGDAEYAERGVEEDIGDYDVMSFKDGSLSVGGSVEEIRAALPEGVTGRIKGDRLLFTTSDAPRVMAALAGKKNAYSREGRVLDRKPMKAGKYIGAPAKYDSPSKITHLRRWMRQLADEGSPGRFWYENSSRAILNFVGGDVQEARKFVALLAIYSPQAKVDTNSTFALRAWSQYKAGHPIKAKTRVMDEKAREALSDIDKFWSGQKTGNFFNNLLREIDPTTAGKQGATIDMWMMRAAYYSSDAPTDTQYAFMEDEINRIAADLGWEPQQVQAAIWVAMKARMENSGVKKRTEASSERKGWIRFDRTAKGKPKRVILNKQKHRDNWLDHAFAHDPTQKDTNTAKFDFEDGVRRHIGQVSWEAAPSVINGILPGLHTAPWAQRVEFQQAVQQALHDEHGDMLARYLGLLADDDLLAPGAWQGAVNPSMQIPVAMSPAGGKAGKTSVDAAQKKLLNVYAATLGLVLHQDGVGWHRPFYSANKGDSNGLDILLGRVISQTEMSDLYNAINDRMTRDGKPGWQDDMALISSPTGVRVISFGVITNKELQTSFLKAIEPSLPDAKVRLFASDGDMPTNKWRENPNGQTYIDRLSAEGRPDVLEWARAVLSPRVQRVFDEFSGRYGWGESDISFSEDARPAEPPRGSSYGRDEGAGRGVRGAVTGVHYGNAAGLSILSGRAFGQGIRGEERARLDAATDARIKRRVYFYLTNNGQDLPAPESGLGGHVYRAELGNLYDGTTATKEQRQLIQGLRKGPGENAYESAILDAGFRGHVNREQGTAVVLNSDVPVAYEGTIDWTRVRQRVNERIVPPIETREEGGELVRKITNEQMLGVIKARPELARVAPSFTMQYGEARVAASEAAAANAALADSGLQFSEDAVTQSRLPFYSALDRAIEGGPKQAPVEQWLAFIKGLTGKGVKPDEVFWSGIEDWLKLQTGKVQRDAVRAFLASSGVKVEEKILSSEGVMTEQKARDELAEKYFLKLNENDRLRHIDEEADYYDVDLASFAPKDRRAIQELVDVILDGGDKDAPKYDTYTLPGGTNYREMLLKLPPASKTSKAEQRDAIAKLSARLDGFNIGSEEFVELFRQRRALTDAYLEPKVYKSSHWDDHLNVIAHIRLNDRTIGGKKTLFVEELQSDWQQQRRKNLKIATTPMAMAGAEKQTPAAPFIDSTDKWLGLAIKRVLVEAVKGDYSQVAFINGTQSADRYDLSKQIDAIDYRRITVGAADETDLHLVKNGSVIKTIAVKNADLENYVGKEMAKKIMANEGKQIEKNGFPMTRLDGLDLKIGGKGMITFYDSIVPTAVNSLLKKLGGGKVAQISMPRYTVEPDGRGWWNVLEDGAIYENKPTEKIARALADRQNGAVPDQFAFNVTPELKAKVEEGLPLFSEDYNPMSFNGFATSEEMMADRARREAEGASLGKAWDRVRAGWPEIKPDTSQTPVAWPAEKRPDPMTTFAGMGKGEYDARRAKLSFSEDAQFANNVAATRPRNVSSWAAGRDELGRFTFGPGAKAYEVAATIANNVLDVVKMKPISPELDRAMRKMKVEIEKAQMTAVDVANKLKEIPRDELEMISDVIEGELKVGVTPPQRVYDIAASMIQIMREQSTELVRLGMLSAEAVGRWDGKYLPRFYEQKLLEDLKAWKKMAAALTRRTGVMQGVAGKSLKARGKFETVFTKDLPIWIQQGWEVRDDKFQKGDKTVQVWRDYTKKEREDMGEVRDAMFRFIMGYTRTQRDIQLGRLFERLATDVAVKGPRDGYVEVPSTKIEGTFAPRYGKLAGMYVPTEVLDHLKSYDDAMHSEILKMYRKGLSLWKEGKTVLNPVAHANNVISNLTMAHFAGVSYWDVNKYAGAVKDLTKNAPMVQEAKDAGLFLGTFSQGELVAAMPEQLRMLAGRVESRGAKTVETVWNAMSFWLRKPMGKAYEAEDQFFRYLIYRDARNRGASPDEAVDFAQRYIFTYDNLPSGAKLVRDVGLPFFAYTYKAVPAILRTAMEYPWRFAAPAGAFWAVNTLMYALAFVGDDDDDEGMLDVIGKYVTDPQFRASVSAFEKDERKNLPPWMKGMSMTMFTPKAIRLGMDEVTDMPVFLDISRIFPGGDLLDANNNSGGMPLFQPLMPGNPVLTTAMAMLGNKDMFFGKEIVDKDLDTDTEAAAKRAAWMWRQVSPAIAVGNYHWDRAANALANIIGEPIELGPISYTGQDKSGNPVQWEYAAMQTFGIKARPIDLELSEIIGEANKKRVLRELASEIKKINRLEGKGYYSETNAERMRENAKLKRDRVRSGLTIEGDSIDGEEEEE